MSRSDLPASSRRRSRSLFLALGAALFLAVPGAEAFDPSKGGATVVPEARWSGGALKPESIVGDRTAFAFHSDPKQNDPFYFAVDVEAGHLFVVTGRGLQVYSTATPANPSFLGYGYGPNLTNQGMGGLMPSWQHSDQDFFLKDVDAPPGNSNVVAVAGEGQGFVVWNTSNKMSPTVHYQDERIAPKFIYSANLSNKDYAFATATDGVYLYDLTAAQTKTKCLDSTGAINCAGVAKGKVGTITSANHIDGTGNFLAVARLGSGFEIWNVANPLLPTKVLSGGSTAQAIAIWEKGGSHYVATSNGATFKTYNVSCITGGSCTAPTELSSKTLPLGSSSFTYLTASKAGTTPFVYVGGTDTFSCLAQREYLFDMSNPASPQDITPQVHPEGYWGWYYERCNTGFNWVSPRRAKFSGDYLYRAAYSLLDVHKLANAAPVPPVANFSWSPAEIYPGTPVTFTDLSTGSPAADQWSWTFAGSTATPTSSVKNPAVTFDGPGEKQVGLMSRNSAGWSAEVKKNVMVINPAVQIGGITVSPTAPTQCQKVTFTATGVTGKPALSYGWTLTDGANPQPSGSANPFEWQTSASAATPPGVYTATVTVTNASGPVSKNVLVTLSPLGTLPAAGQFTPAPVPPPPSGTVEFDGSLIPGATEWSWDFGDGSGWSAWSSNPKATHSYTAVNIYQVKVRVRNCTTVTSEPNGRESAAIAVDIKVITPLVAKFTIGALCDPFACYVTANNPVTFTDQSTGADKWWFDWNGNNNFSDDGAALTASDFDENRQLKHTFTAQGTLTLRLKVTRGAEETIYTLNRQILVGAAQQATISISGPTSGQPNAALSFSAAASGCNADANGWSWNAPGGTVTGGNAGSVTIAWAGAGNQTFTVTNSGCGSVSDSHTVVISNGGGNGGGGGGGSLAAQFTFSPAAPAANQPVSFNGSSSTGSPASYVWDFGDNTPLAVGAQVTHTFTRIGTFNVQLAISKPGNCAPAPFCEHSVTKTVTVGSGEALLGASFQTNATCVSELGLNLCTAATGQAVTFTSTSTGSPTAWSWNFGDGGTATGAAVTHTFQQPGSFTVTLTVGKGASNASTSRTFNVSGEALLGASFETSATCVNELGLNACSATTGQAVTFTSTSAGNPESQSWSFGDGGSANGASATHTFAQAGNYTVTLTVGKGGNTSSTSKTFNVTGGVIEPETSNTIVLPWVAQSRGALQQTSNLFVHNPGKIPMEVVLEFRRQGQPEANPPRAALTIQPGATQYVVDVLKGLFKVENTVGFVTITKTKGDRNPVMTSYNTISGKKGSQYGQTVPSVALSREGTAAATTGSRVQYLVGLNDNSDRQAYFGITNPNAEPAVYRLKFFDSLGRPIGTPGSDITLPSFGARQYQLSEIRSQFGITTEDDYRVEVETVSGKQLYPYGTNVQTISKDPSYQGVGQSKARLYLIGAMRTKGLQKSEWQSDIVLSNTGSEVALADVSFLNAGPASQPTAPIKVTLQPGQTDRMENVGKSWNVKDSVGLLKIESDAPNGLFPVVQGESYLSTTGKPGARYGLAMAAFTDEDAAEAGEAHYLVGLRHDANNRSTVWVYNSSNEAGNYDLIYRGLDGKELGRVSNVALGAGKLRQFNPSQHPLKAVGKKGGGVAGGFTIEVVVKSGKVIAAAQVVNNKTNDPSYIQGQTAQ